MVTINLTEACRAEVITQIQYVQYIALVQVKFDV